MATSKPKSNKSKRNKSKIADQYVQTVVVMDGMSEDIAKQFTEGFEEAEKKTAPASEEMGEKSGKGFSKGMVTAVAASGAAVAIGALFSDAVAKGMDQMDVNSKLGASLSLDPEDLSKVTEVAKDLYNDSYGETYDATVATMKAIVGTVKGAKDATAEELRVMGRDVINIADIWDLTSEEVVTSASNMVNNGMAGSFNEAVSLIAGGFKTLGGQGEDWLDTINEFSSDFKTFGFEGENAVSLIKAAVDAGLAETGLLGDALNEMSITLRDGSIDEDLINLGMDPDQIRADLFEGGEVARSTLFEILQTLQNDGNVANFAAVMGSLGEDFNASFMKMDLTAARTQIDGATADMDKLNTTFKEGPSDALSDMQRTLDSAFTDLMIPILESVTPHLIAMVQWLTENEGMIKVIAIAVGVLLVGSIILMTMALWGMAAAGWAAMAPFAGPILIAIGVVMLLVGAFLLVQQNWDAISKFFIDTIDWIVEAFRNLWEMITSVGSAIGDWWDSLWSGGDKNVTVTQRQEIKGGVPQMAEGGTIRARPGGTLAILGEAGRDEVVTDAGEMNKLIADINNRENSGGDNVTYELTIIQKENQSTADLVEEIVDYIEFTRTR